MAAGERRSSSGNAVTTTLTSSIGAADTSIPLSSSTGYPDGTNGPFFVRIDSETIKCIGRTGLNLNVQTTPSTGRGWEGTVASTHNASTSVVNFAFTSTDADDANKHYADTAQDNHTQYLNATRHDTTTRHPASVLPLGSPGNSAPGDTASAGTASTIPRSDHRHGREPDTTTRCGCTLDSTAFSCAASTSTSILWTSEAVDTDGFIVADGTHSTITIPAGKGGIYALSVRGSWSSTFTEPRQLVINIGTATYAFNLASGNLFSTNWAAGMSGLPLAAAATISVSIIQFNAGAQSTTAHLDLYRVAG